MIWLIVLWVSMIGHAAFGPEETPYIMTGNNVGDRESYLPQSWNWEQEEEKGCEFTVLFEDVSFPPR